VASLLPWLHLLFFPGVQAGTLAGRDSTYLLPYTDAVIRVESLLGLAQKASDGGLSEVTLILSKISIMVSSIYLPTNLLCLMTYSVA
jgi:hypothetical protein